MPKNIDETLTKLEKKLTTKIMTGPEMVQEITQAITSMVVESIMDELIHLIEIHGENDTMLFPLHRSLF